MSLRRPSSCWALWLFAAALLLKSAMPFLATASAQVQDKALVEVCTVYGVSLLPGGDDHRPTEQGADHASEHCALTALTTLASAEPPALAPVRLVLRAATPRCAQAPLAARDACASWAARFQHGPPAFV